MSDSDSLQEQLHGGQTLHSGQRARLEGTALFVDDVQIELNTIKPLWLDDKGHLLITRIGAGEPLMILPADEVEDVDAFLEAVNVLVAEVPYLQRRSVTGWPPGSVGDVNARIGYDVRELWMAGYNAAEIDSVVYGNRTVEDLLKHKPGERPGSSQKHQGKRSGNL